MITDIQKASLWKRISAFLFDLIIFGIVAVLIAWGISAITGYDGYNQKLQGKYVEFGEKFGVDFDMTLEEFEALSEEEQKNVEAAQQALASDEETAYTYGIVVALTIMTVSLAMLFSYLILDFIVPLMLGHGRSLGKKIFGLALVTKEGVKIRGVSLFIRTLLGKFALETMIPIIILFMMFTGSIGILGPVLIFGILLIEVVCLCASPQHGFIHDVLASSVCVDFASQMIFDTPDAKLAYIKRSAAARAAKDPYR